MSFFSIRISQLSIFLFLIAAVSSAQAEEHPLPKTCTYEHLALFKVPRADDEQFNGVTLPVYIGYVKTTEMLARQGILNIEFIKTTSLPTTWVGRVFRVLDKTGAVHIPYMAPVPISTDDEFWWRFHQKLEEEGAYYLKWETYTGEPFPEPKLTAEDFEFEDICVYRPFDDPPEFCDGLKVKLKNDPMAKHAKRDVPVQ